MSKKRKSGEEIVGVGHFSKRMREEEEEEDDINDLDASQRPDFEVNTREAEVGIIEQISLKNFMCHTRLDFKFCPHINFVVGRNGSGKSAVMTALVVGLGGKASLTNRGTSVKGFIKHGKQTAEVMVRLRNRGPDAFKPQEYGEAIIVERSFRADGPGAYRLKSKEGRLVSTKREELIHILDQFNIQVDNPVAILNQDTSRNFLNSSKPQDKYKFFLKATQLEQMKIDYAYANDQRKFTMEIIEQKERMIPKLEKEVREWEQKFKALMSLDELRKKVEDLKKEMAWALVANKEKDLEPFAKQLRVEEARMPKFEKKVAESKEKVDECLTRRQKTQKDLQALSNEVKELEPQFEGMKKTVNEKKKVYKAAVYEWRKFESDYKNYEKEKKQLLERIDEIRNSERQDQSDRLAREENINSLKQEIEMSQDEQRGLEVQLEQHRNAVSRLKEEQYRIRVDEKELRSIMAENRSQIQQLESSKNDNLRKFGTYIPDLVRNIEKAFRDRRFHQKPRGPIGAQMHLRDQSWALAVESCLKSLLFSFCCHDIHDERVLEQVMRETGIPMGKKPATIVSRFLRSKSRDFPAVLDVLEVEDPVIANCLVDQRSIENIILIKDPVVARALMMKKPPPSHNIREAFTPAGDMLYHTPTFRYYSSNIDSAQYLKANVEENIRFLNQKNTEIQSQLTQVDQRARVIDTEIREAQRQERAVQTRLMKNREKMGKIQLEIDELRNIEEPEAVDIITLEEEVQKYDEQLENLEEALRERKEKVDETKAMFEEADAQFKEVDQRIRAVADMADPLKEDLGKIDGEIEYARNNKRHYDAKLDEHKKKVQSIEKELQEAKDDLEEKIRWAEEICERINTRRSPHNLESEILQITKRIKTEEKNRGNKEEITRKYYETLNKFKKIKQEVKKCSKFIQMLEDAMALRAKRYILFRGFLSLRVGALFNINLVDGHKRGRLTISHSRMEIWPITLKDVMNDRQRQYFEFRRMIAMRARYFFIMMLSNRNYQGKINFNHQKEVLNLAVHPGAGGADDGAKDMRSLSGGERSFATVCFILALWDAMESPFRCLDEFDVFMDMVNRRISMDMMQKAANQQKGRQFIFLTPQHLSHIAQGPNCRIYKMPDPERGQMTLDVSRNEEDEDA